MDLERVRTGGFHDHLRMVEFGDSITSDEISGIGTLVAQKVTTAHIANFAHGNARCQDWRDEEGHNMTPITFDTPFNSNTEDNVLSNQIRRCLRHTTPAGETVTWKHPIDGIFEVEPELGTGLGYTQEVPDIAYIAIGINDGKSKETPVVDDCDAVFSQSYTQLTRTSMASALRWAIETLQSAYPAINIYVATPLMANCDSLAKEQPQAFSFPAVELKAEIIRKVCAFCHVRLIDSYAESGFSMMIAKKNGELHPNRKWCELISRFVAKEIVTHYIDRTYVKKKC